MAKKNDSFYWDNFSVCAKAACDAARLLDEIMRNFDPVSYTHLRISMTMEPSGSPLNAPGMAGSTRHGASYPHTAGRT